MAEQVWRAGYKLVMAVENARTVVVEARKVDYRQETATVSVTVVVDSVDGLVREAVAARRVAEVVIVAGGKAVSSRLVAVVGCEL